MAVGIDIKVDPSGAVSGGRTATASLDQIEKAADGATAAVDKTSKATKEFGAIAPSAAVGVQKLDKQVKASSASFKKFSGFVGQAGFQVSDIAIQLAAGANAASVLGIQGGQLIGFLNPLAGALATISGILIGQFTGGMYSSAEATKTLTERTRELSEEYTTLTRNQALFLSVELTENLSDQEKQAEKTRAKIETYQMQLARFPGSAKAEEWNAALVEQKANLDTVEDEIKKTSDTLEIYSQVVEGQSIASDSAARQIKALTGEIQVSELAVKGYNREAVVQAALNRLGADATEEQRRQVELLTGQLFDLNEKQSAVNVSVKEYDKDGQYIQRLKDQAAAIGLTARESALLRAEQGLSDDATGKQIEQARELAASIFDATAEQKRQAEIARVYQNTLDGLNPSVDNYIIRMDALTLAQQNGVISAQQLSAEMVRVQQSFSPESISFAESFNLQFQQVTEGAQNMEASLGEIYGNTFGTLSSSIGQATTDMLLFGASGEDAARQVAQAVAGQLISSLVELGVQYALNAALGEAIAAASLAATSASAVAASAAWATPAALASLATLGTNAAPATAAVAGTVAASQAVALSSAAIPAFADGGLAYGPGTGKSDSFTAKLSNGEFVMPARETARNLGTLQSMRAGNDVTGGGAPNIQIVNQTTGKIDSASSERIDADTVRVIIREEVPGIISAEVNDEYSHTNKAMQSQYTMQRKF